MNMKHPRLSKMFNLGFLFIMVVMAAIVIFGINVYEHRLVLREAETLARSILERNLAIHTYFSRQLKPAVFPISKLGMSPDYFDPVWMSSTYAVREIDNYYQDTALAHHKTRYYYKECAINARSPQNEADPYEKHFIEELNSNPDLEIRSVVRDINGYPYFTVLHRGEVIEKNCLKCHSTPERAPADLVKRYGPERSFGRHVGEVVSAVSIRIPLAVTFAQTNIRSLKLSVIALILIALTYSIVTYLSNRFIFSPIKELQDATQGIARHTDSLGDQVSKPFGRELFELANSFNLMSARLAENRDELEGRVTQRTNELEETNKVLEREIETIRRLEEERDQTIAKLQTALTEVDVLSGILPICLQCKKIRDEEGHWKQLESYISERTDADFSHGYCPECAQQMLDKIKKD